MIKIKSEDAYKRLDKYLADNIEDYSRSQLQKLIKNGKVSVNNEKVSSNYSLKEGDEIVIDYTEEKETKEEKIEKKVSAHKLSDIILEKKKEYFIINKPAGLIVHGADHIKEETLVDILLKKYPKLKSIGEDPMRPAIVHRIDKDVSGLMIIPRTQDSFDNIKKQFQKRTLKKEYTALVYGQIEKEQDEIRFPIKRSRDGYKMAALPETLNGEQDLQGGKRAITNFKVIEKFINYTLVKVSIKTGRTHQIRVHMLAYGHPIVGDVLYNTRKTKERNEKFRLARLFLVANKLSFDDLSGERQEYQINLPDKLENFLEKIK